MKEYDAFVIFLCVLSLKSENKIALEITVRHSPSYAQRYTASVHGSSS